MPLQAETAWIALAAVAALLWIASVRSTILAARRLSPRPAPAVLAGLAACRAIVLAGLLVAFTNPKSLKPVPSRTTPTVAVILDDSLSMSITDTPDSPTRWNEARRVLEEDWIPVLTPTHSVQTSGLETPSMSPQPRVSPAPEPEPTIDRLTPARGDSPLAPALRALAADSVAMDLRHVIVASDGRWTDPEEVFAAAREFRQRGIPIHTLALGQPVEQPDVRLNSVRVTRPDPFEDDLLAEIEVEAPGFDGRTTQVNVRHDDRILASHSLVLRQDAQMVDIRFRTPFRGFHPYAIDIEPLPGERLSDNNGRVFGFGVTEPRIRVLYMEGTPGETAALEDALEEDPTIDVTSLYFPQYQRSMAAAREAPYQTDRAGRRIYNVAHPRHGFPTTLEGLLEFDVVINSDIYREAFTPEQLRDTVRLVEEFGGGFVMVGGHTAFGAGHYDETVIDKLMPVDVHDERDLVNAPFQLRIPDDARSHPILQVGRDEAETRRAWTDGFPGFFGMNRVSRPKPGAIPIAVHASESNRFGPLVVFAVQQIGRGRTMAFTPDTTPSWGALFQSRWGTPTDPRAYYRAFWNNAVRWLAADRVTRRNRRLEILPPETIASTGAPVRFIVPENPEWRGENLAVRVTAPDETLVPVRLFHQPEEDRWIAEIMPESPGIHVATAELQSGADSQTKARTLVSVVEDRRELDSTVAVPENLRRLTLLARGQALDGRSRDDLEDLFAANVHSALRYREEPLWDRWWFLLALAGLLGGEWFARRRVGLA